LGVATASLILTLVIFFLIPRLGRTFLPLGGQFGTLTTGFTDRVELGIYGAIQSDPTIVMRVSFPEDVVAPERLPNLRWRGVAFDSFDGRSWTLTDAARSQVRRLRDGHYAVAPHPIGTPFLSYEVLLDPLGTEVLFGLPRVTAIQGRLPGVAVDAEAVALPTPPTTPHPLCGHLAAGTGGRSRSVSRSRRHVPQRIASVPALQPSRARRALAEELAAERARRSTRAQGEAYLAQNLRYSLDLGRETDLDPLDDFSSNERPGTAVLCRCDGGPAPAAGIPARVVNRFQRGVERRGSILRRSAARRPLLGRVFFPERAG
jgi:hypothetical protein